ncbi:MAG: biliverdin-producing heme oxygenase [Canibacter sp.]
MSVFSAEVVDRVLDHMNDDHVDDNLVIARAYGFPDVKKCRMSNLDENAGFWEVNDDEGAHELRIEWPDAPIAERPQIRREVVKIYTTASDRLGLPPKAEEQPAEAQPAHGHGHSHHGRHASPHATTDTVDAGFAKVVRERTWSFHGESEGAGFMSGIMQDGSPLDDYTKLVAQHYFMYEAIEAQSDKFKNDEIFGAFDTDGLRRMAAIEADLEHLVGADWADKISPLPATRAYAARVNQVGDEGWVPGVIAHHYTRYLGDLSGGQMISKRMRQRHGLDGAGVAFYEFASLGPLGKFKNDYRAELDKLGEILSDEEKERFLEEVRLAYQFNTDVFNDLAKQKAAELAAS